jgi:hypothetical protein
VRADDLVIAWKTTLTAKSLRAWILPRARFHVLLPVLADRPDPRGRLTIRLSARYQGADAAHELRKPYATPWPVSPASERLCRLVR